MIILSNKYIHKSTLEKGNLDYIGTISSLVGIIALVYGIDVSKFRIISFIIAIIALGIFIYQESRFNQPIVPLSLFSNKERTGAYIARLFFMGAMLSFWFLTPELMQDKLHFTPLMSGIGFFPLTFINFFVALKVAKLTKRFGNGKLLFIGLLTTLIGIVFMVFFSVKLGYLLGIAIPMIFIGAGQGMSLSPLTVAGISHTTPKQAGSASGVVNTVHQVGGSIGFSIVIAISGLFLNNSYNIGMVICTVFLAIALLCTTILIIPNEKK